MWHPALKSGLEGASGTQPRFVCGATPEQLLLAAKALGIVPADSLTSQAAGQAESEAPVESSKVSPPGVCLRVLDSQTDPSNFVKKTEAKRSAAQSVAVLLSSPLRVAMKHPKHPRLAVEQEALAHRIECVPKTVVSVDLSPRQCVGPTQGNQVFGLILFLMKHVFG